MFWMVLPFNTFIEDFLILLPGKTEITLSFVISVEVKLKALHL
jgi:hypothetical protein